MNTISYYKDRALSSLKGQWGQVALVTLIFGGIYYGGSTALSLVFSGDETTNQFVSAIWIILLLPLGWGMAVYMLNLSRGTQNQSVSRVFDGYSDFSRIFTTLFLKNVYTLLWTLLFIVPGIIKSLSYAMTDYVLKDDPEKSGNEAIEESMRLMEGHKMDLFLLELSFIGWGLLCIFTLGLGFLLLIPYMQTTIAHFYQDLLAENSYAGNGDDDDGGGSPYVREFTASAGSDDNVEANLSAFFRSHQDSAGSSSSKNSFSSLKDKNY